ncbi:toxin co-regulated pilus biosynthesis Q family protein [Ralstonia pickettii]|uniref:toxin co-regulated pilus biosynthesis Q family protein n=1 Tax=Ralstonia pickettii TaxID=329 RepID=UPI0029C9BDEE|nr:toxin co-regulated pilus biosynthesis Q family protein [Ralstonia pickettii]
MRPISPRMLFAAFALAACCAMSVAQAATSRHSAIPDEMDELSDDGWQPLGSGQPASEKVAQKPTRTTKQSAQTPAPKPVQAAPAPATETASMTSSQAYVLVAGESGESQLLAWAKRAGWTVLWNVQDAWIVPGNKSYGNDFETAVKQVTEDLHANGADVLGDSWRGNSTIIITQNGAAAQ